MASVKNVLEFVREEDFVEYFLFPTITTNDIKEQECILNSLLKKIQKEVLDKYCDNYIWYRDDFKLTPRTRMTNLLAIENENKGKQQIIIIINQQYIHCCDLLQKTYHPIFMVFHITVKT